MSIELNERIIHALRSARESVRQSSSAIAEAYVKAEHSGDYSDADEMAADYREHLHDEFDSLLGLFAEEYPSLFEGES